MDKVRLFLKAAVGEEEVESYIKGDHWVEFPTRVLGAILAEYEAAQNSVKRTGWWACKKCNDINIDEYANCVECGTPRA
jgi:hypothetical protein